MPKDINKTISAFSHAIKNPLHSATINLEVVRKRLTRSNLSDAKEILKHTNIIDKDLRKLQAIVDHFLKDIGKS